MTWRATGLDEVEEEHARGVAPLQESEDVVEEQPPVQHEEEETAAPAGVSVEAAADTAQPTKEERDAHALTHLPYKSWCRVCIAARGRDMPHYRLLHDQEDGEVPLVEIDYGYLSSEGERPVPLLAGATSVTGHGFGVVCGAKGPGDEAAVRAALRFLQEAGIHGTCRLRSDSEPAIIAMAQTIARRREPAKTVVETTPVGSSSSLGLAESWIGLLVGQVRCLKAIVEEKWHIKVRADTPVLHWAVLHSAWLLNRFQPKARTGVTPYRTIQQHDYRGCIFGFADPVMVRRSEALDQPKLADRWLSGVWLGKTTMSDAHVVGCPEQLVVSRTARGVPWDQKVNELMAQMQ